MLVFKQRMRKSFVGHGTIFLQHLTLGCAKLLRVLRVISASRPLRPTDDPFGVSAYRFPLLRRAPSLVSDNRLYSRPHCLIRPRRFVTSIPPVNSISLRLVLSFVSSFVNSFNPQLSFLGIMSCYSVGFNPRGI